MLWSRTITLAVAVLVAATPVVAAEKAEAWSKVKSGMTPAEVKTVLGEPLIQNHGRGFELWMYDSGAEVVCFLGVVVAWTGPEGARTVEGRAIDLRGIKFNALPVANPKPRSQGTPSFGYEPLGTRTFRLPRF